MPAVPSAPGAYARKRAQGKSRKKAAQSAARSARRISTPDPRPTPGMTAAELQAVEAVRSDPSKKAQRKARRAAKAYKGPKASEGTALQAIERFKEGVKSPEDLYQEKLASQAPTGIKIVRALTGDEPGRITPSLEEVGNVALGVATGTAGRIARAPAVAKASNAVTAAEKAATAARTARRAADAKTVTAAKKISKAKKALDKTKVRYSAPERKLRRAKRLQKTTVRATDPTTVAAATTDPVRGLAEGTVRADPIQTAKTTGRAIPATLAFGATLAGDAVKAATTGDTGPLEGTLKQGKNAFKSLEPLVSGDPDAVEKAMEEEIGYWFAPLVPKGLASPVGRALKAGTKKLPLRARQVVEGPGTRKRVATQFARETQRARFEAGRAARDIERPARKIRKARSFRNLRGVEGGDAVSVLARYGISRKNPEAQLDKVVRSLTPEDAGEITNVRKVSEFLRDNPDVLKDKNLWKAVDAYKSRSKQVETSERATNLAQARVLGVRPPEERVPTKARPLTKAKTRGEAWADYESRKKAVAKAKYDSRVGFASGNTARGLQKRAEAQRLESEAKALHRELKPYTRADRPPSILQKSKQWDSELVKEFTDEVKAAAKKEGFETPAWTAERRLPDEGAIGGPQLPASGTRRTHIKTGKAEASDVADRSLRELVQTSVYAPRMQRALHRTVTRFTADEAIPVNGKKVITGEEWSRAVANRQVDPREYVLLPSRQWKTALEGEEFASGFFDLDELHADVTGRLKKELHQLGDTPGTKYVVVKKEAAREFADQVNPNGSGLETFLNTTGMAGTRVILGLSPAWMLAQVAAEGLQAVAAVSNPVRLAKSVHAVRKLRKTDPEGYEAFAGVAGESSASFDPPNAGRVEMNGSTQQVYADAGRALRRTAVGRAIYNTGTLRVLGLFDRWKGGKYRSVLTAARADKELNGFIRGLQGVMREQDAIAKKLKGQPLDKQLGWLARNPRALDKHLDYLDDVMGNWNAFTRFERQFAPALVFYPFLRMSLRWTFWSYPKTHPVKAQVLYLLAQQNAEELEKTLGVKPDFLQLAQPVLHGEDGEVAGVLPGGTRFATPGSNVLTQAIGEQNMAGLVRALNPFAGAAIFTATGVDPMSGEQTDVNRGLLALNQLLSFAAPARAFGLNRFGKQDSPVTDKYREYDPDKALRSLINPFEGQSAEQARKQAKLSATLEEAGQFDSEEGQVLNRARQIGGGKLTRAAAQQAIAEYAADKSAGRELSKAFKGEDVPQWFWDMFYAAKFGKSSSSSADTGFGGGGGFSGGSGFGGGSGF